MSVATEISKLQENLMDAYSSIESKGGTLPENQNFDNLSTSINSISSGISYTAGTGIDISNDVISVTNNISTGAALGTTAVQPADLNDKADTDLSNINTNGKSFASGLSMPSSRYINLTLGASGASYSAPANGFVYLSKFGNQGQFAQISCGISILNTSPFDGGIVIIWLPVKKGNSFIVSYDLSGSTSEFKFYYAEGN